MIGLLLAVGCTGSSDTLTGDTGPTSTLPEGVFLVDLDTTQGPVVLEIHEDWAPLGVARFRELVESDFYDGARFFRVIDGFVAQWGIAADPAVTAMWRTPIDDDPVIESNTRRMLSFAATSAPNSRTTQVFVNYDDNSRLDDLGFAPFGLVVEGMPNLRALYADYGEDVDQAQLVDRGNAYLDEAFPNLDEIRTATIRE